MDEGGCYSAKEDTRLGLVGEFLSHGTIFACCTLLLVAGHRQDRTSNSRRRYFCI